MKGALCFIVGAVVVIGGVSLIVDLLLHPSGVQPFTPTTQTGRWTQQDQQAWAQDRVQMNEQLRIYATSDGSGKDERAHVSFEEGVFRVRSETQDRDLVDLQVAGRSLVQVNHDATVFRVYAETGERLEVRFVEGVFRVRSETGKIVIDR